MKGSSSTAVELRKSGDPIAGQRPLASTRRRKATWWSTIAAEIVLQPGVQQSAIIAYVE